MNWKLLSLSILPAACLAGNADAQWGFGQPVPTTVVEYKHVGINHYFLTASSAEQAAIDAGAAGPGWYRTGFGFSAYVADQPLCSGCQPVARFHGTPGLGPNSHFYTASAAEAEGLKQPGSGWSYEGVGFSIQVPNAAGACSAGLVPVYRLYNNRWMFNDSNHRYVTDAGQRAGMIAEGWIDEGVRFCSMAEVEVPLKSFNVVVQDPQNILPSAQCEDEAVHLGSCIAVNNLPVPNKLVGPFSSANAEAISTIAGQWWDYVYASSSGDPASGVTFLNREVLAVPGGLYNGLHIETLARGASRYSSMNPLYQFKTQVGANGSDERLFPWHAWGPFETQISMKGSFNVVMLQTRGADSHAYGHPTIEFIDRTSGHHVYFTMLAYGTVAGGDFVAPDVTTGKVIVGTTLRRDSPFGRSLGGEKISTPSGYTAHPNAAQIQIDYRMNRGEFQLVLGAARSVDPALSGNPDDYFIDNFHFTNEVVGDGAIGVSQNLSLVVLRRR